MSTDRLSALPLTRLAGHGPEAEISTDAKFAAYIERAGRQLDALSATG